MSYQSDYMQDYFRSEPENLPSHKCASCESLFYTGIRVDRENKEKFCDKCIDHLRHYAYYINEGWSIRLILESLDRAERLD
jgi:hypothetical protein